MSYFRPPVLGLALVTAAAFGLRVIGIGNLGDLDFDEQASFFIGSMPPGEMVAYLVRAPFEHPPAYYLLLHVWLAATGPSEAAMRLFSVLLGTLAVPLVGLAAGRMGGPRAGLVASIALAVLPLHVFYSRDARMYPFLTALMALVLVSIGDARWRWLSWGAAAAALATHYYALVALVGVAAGVAVPAVWGRRADGRLSGGTALF